MTAALPRAFRWFWAGEAVSGFGSRVTMIALQVIVVDHLHAGTVGLGWLNAARWLPYLLFGLVLGALLLFRAVSPSRVEHPTPSAAKHPIATRCSVAIGEGSCRYPEEKSPRVRCDSNGEECCCRGLTAPLRRRSSEAGQPMKWMSTPIP
jgi:hypothetical protein